MKVNRQKGFAVLVRFVLCECHEQQFNSTGSSVYVNMYDFPISRLNLNVSYITVELFVITLLYNRLKVEIGLGLYRVTHFKIS